VKTALSSLPDVISVDVSKENESATITMKNHIPLNILKGALPVGGKYMIHGSEFDEPTETRSWFQTYKPVIIIFAYITVLSVIGAGSDWKLFMNLFMGGFFIAFSFFKMLDLGAFAESYSMYDIVARRFKSWGYIYAFTELILGLAYLLHFYPLITNSITFIIMIVSIIGVLQSVLNKRKIQCACLGAVFNLPMSTVTIIEDALMIFMSGAMLVHQALI
jgi:hypothetical protein